MGREHDRLREQRLDRKLDHPPHQPYRHHPRTPQCVFCIFFYVLHSKRASDPHPRRPSQTSTSGSRSSPPTSPPLALEEEPSLSVPEPTPPSRSTPPSTSPRSALTTPSRSSRPQRRRGLPPRLEAQETRRRLPRVPQARSRPRRWVSSPSLPPSRFKSLFSSRRAASGRGGFDSKTIGFLSRTGRGRGRTKVLGEEGGQTVTKWVFWSESNLDLDFGAAFALRARAFSGLNNSKEGSRLRKP